MTILCASNTDNSKGGCPYRITAVTGGPGQVRLSGFVSGHTCGGGARKRQVKVDVLKRSAAAIGNFIPAKGRTHGNTKQLQNTVKGQHGISLKRTQAASLIAEKIGDDAHHLAQYRLLPSVFTQLRAKDPAGVYELTTRPAPNGGCSTALQFVSFFIAPSGMIKNAQHFEPVGSVDCSHLKTMTKGQLCALTAYDASKHIATMCFALFRTETSANWEMFMERVFKYFPRFKTIISDGAKGLESLARLFAAHGVFHARCFWHVIEKNARQNGIAMTDADKARAWTIVMSRTREFALFHSERLMSDNRKLFDFISPNLPVCASYELLEQGKPRRGLKTSNPSEQFNGAVGVVREGAVVDLLTGVL